ncbi:MAG: 50S ribosomal protein L28 [Candidatus Subteraquimicrobiales bacterium]|nr:50S ribosomal protein L28 [Candidatus Subteraquimicrobiales bacterium]
MSKKCEICGKAPSFGNNVSHSHRKTRRVWNVNIQRAKLLIDGKPKRVYACAKCLKTDKLTKAL